MISALVCGAFSSAGASDVVSADSVSVLSVPVLSVLKATALKTVHIRHGMPSSAVILKDILSYHKGKTEEISEKQYNTYMDSLYYEFNERMSLG